MIDFDALWDYAKPEETEQKFRALLPQARESGDAGYLAELLTQIARTEGLQHKFNDAHKTLDEAETLLRPGVSRPRVRSLLERGRAFNSSGHPDKARPLFLEALEIAEIAGEDNLAVDAAHMMGIIEPPDKALDWNLRAIGMAETSKDRKARQWLGSLYNNIGWNYYETKKYDMALHLFELALEFREKQKQAPQIRIAKWCVAKTLRVLGRIDEALEIHKALLIELEKIGEPDGFVFEEMGECLLALGKPEDAKPHFTRAFDLLSKDSRLPHNEPERLVRLKSLGK